MSESAMHVSAYLLAELVDAMVKSLVDDATAVLVESDLVESAVLLTVHVADGDVGKVIGKQGRTARSMRTIVGGAAAKLGVKCELNILDAGRKP